MGNKRVLFSWVLVGLLAAPLSIEGSPLAIHPENQRYFTNHTGKAIYMTGSQAWFILHANGHTVTEARITAFLDWLRTWGHTYTRVWSGWMTLANEKGPQGPWPYQRSGPGTARDGLFKFDFSRVDESYYERLRFLMREIERRRLFCSIMLFGSAVGWREPDYFRDNVAWHPDNNVNPATGSLKSGGDFFKPDAELLELQRAHVRRMVDVLNEYDNFVWEIVNEAKLPDSRDWQFEMIRYLRGYEQAKPKQHLIVMSGGNAEAGSILEGGPADVISPDNSTDMYLGGGPARYVGKIVVNDTDHLWGFSRPLDVERYRKWVWKSFARGHHPIFMDDYDAYINGNDGAINPVYDPVRRGMGDTAGFAARFGNLAKMVPDETRSSTGYCLADPGQEYFVYHPGRAEGNAGQNVLGGWLDRIRGKAKEARDRNRQLTLEIQAGSYALEWFDPRDGSRTRDTLRVESTSRHSFHLPDHIQDDAVLHLNRN